MACDTARIETLAFHTFVIQLKPCQIRHSTHRLHLMIKLVLIIQRVKVDNCSLVGEHLVDALPI